LREVAGGAGRAGEKNLHVKLKQDHQFFNEQLQFNLEAVKNVFEKTSSSSVLNFFSLVVSIFHPSSVTL
jgi:hypothetical protein